MKKIIFLLIGLVLVIYLGFFLTKFLYFREQIKPLYGEQGLAIPSGGFVLSNVFGDRIECRLIGPKFIEPECESSCFFKICFVFGNK